MNLSKTFKNLQLKFLFKILIKSLSKEINPSSPQQHDPKNQDNSTAVHTKHCFDPTSSSHFYPPIQCWVPLANKLVVRTQIINSSTNPKVVYQHSAHHKSQYTPDIPADI